MSARPYDVVLYDLGAYLIVQCLQQTWGVPCQTVKAYFQGKGGLNGGTGVHSLGLPHTLVLSQLVEINGSNSITKGDTLMQIRKDDLTGQKIADFLREHLENMHEVTPPKSVHALDLEALRSPGITFWSAWEGDELLGCGALKGLDSSNGEIKSMRTAIAHRGRGVASKMLERIIQEAKRRSYDCLNLETGSQPEFAPARALYTQYGFEYRGPFAEYTDDPNSIFMTKKL